MRHGRDRLPYNDVESMALEGAPLCASCAGAHLGGSSPRPARPGRLLRSVLALLAVVVALVVAGPAGASQDGEDGLAAAQAELVQENLSSADAAVENESEAAQVAEQGIAGSELADDSTGSSVSDETAPGDPDPEPAEAQNAEAEAAANQQAGANAEATQDTTTNTSVSVAVGQSGDHPAVSQANQASAGAQAGTNALLPASASQGNQNASANASTSQADAANTNVVVLVDSPGDTGPVNQANTSSAAAGAAALSKLPDAAQNAQANAEAAQNGASNTNVSIRVDSPGENGAVAQQNSASAGASAETSSPNGSASATAQASQSDTQNTNVSIRLDSPGEDGPLTQGNSSQATTLEQTGELVEDDLEVESGGSNLDVDLDLTTGLSADVPATWVWTWNWVWDGDEEIDWDAVFSSIQSDLESGSWDWDWSWGTGTEPEAEGQDAGSATTNESGEAGAESQDAGTWTWDWEWDVDLDGWDWDWLWTASAPCECTWTWDWNWTWVDMDSASDDPEISDPTAETEDAIEQTNAVAAEASAQTDATIEQTAEQTQSGESAQTQEAYQITAVSQTVSAEAAAVQTGASNLTTSLDGLVYQLNDAQAVSDATAQSVSLQLILQEQEGTDSEQTQWAGQVVEVIQVASAQSVADQHEVWNWNDSFGSQIVQENATEATATALVASDLTQLIGQGQTGDGSIQSQDAGQLASVIQSHAALSSASQSQASNWNLSVGGDFDQTNASLAGADSQATSTGLQDIVQVAAADGEIDIQEAWQILEVVQEGIAIAVATQSYVGNENVYFAPQEPEQQEPAPAVRGSWSAHSPGSSPSLVEALLPAPAVEPAVPPAVPALVVQAELQGAGSLELLLAEEPGGGVAHGYYQVSASQAGEPGASATRERSTGGHTVVDAEPAEALPPLPAFAPSESGAITGATGGTSSSGPAATAARLLLDVPELSFRVLSPTVRRSAVFRLASERPG